MRFFICSLVCFMLILFLGTRAGISTYTYSYLQTDAEIESYDGFTFTGASGSPLYYDCSGVTYLGGYNHIGGGSNIQRAFSDLPYHYQIQVSFDFIFGNNWYDGDMGYLNADGTQIWSDSGVSNQSNYNTSLDCGCCTLADYPGDYSVAEYTPSPSVTFSHTASTLTLIWSGTNTLPFSYGWFGLRNFVMVLTADCTLANCNTCQSATVCSICDSGYYLYSGSCTTSCPKTGYYPNSTNNTCEACDSTCYTCITSGASSCTSCTGTSYLYQGTCGSTCPTNYFANSADNTCDSCYSTCSACKSAASNACTACISGNFLYGGSCTTYCPTIGYYPDSSNNICEACSSTCYTCTSSGSTSCTSCTGTRYLYQGTCGSTCPTNYFANSADNKCDSCYSTCSACTSAASNTCTACVSGNFLYEGSCTTSCPTGYYPKSADNICEECDSSCYTCNSSEANSCTSCKGSSYLYQGTCGSASPNSGGSCCLQACPLGYTPDNNSNQCVTSLANISEAQWEILVAAPVVTSVALAVSNVVIDGFSINIVICLVAKEALANMQYLNINHSNIASTIYANISSSLMPNWIASFNTLQKETLIFNWGIFKYNQISSLYLDNFGDRLAEIMIYISIYLLALIFALFLKTQQLANSLMGKAYLAAFSFLFSYILGNTQGQILFSILQIIRSDLFLNTYSKLSLITGYLTMFISIGLIVFSFFRVKKIFSSKNRPVISPVEVPNNNEGNLSNQYEWLEKKYELMFGDFKNRSKHRFFFAYWMIAFDTTYILLIFSLQKVPVVQCLSIVVLVLAFIIFSGIIQPFTRRRAAFLHFFNFSCVLVAGIMNLILSIIDAFNDDFSGVEIQGWFVVSVIILNSGANLLFSLSAMLFEIYLRLNKKFKELNIRSKVRRPNRKRVSQKIHPIIQNSPTELNGPVSSDRVLQNIEDAHSNQIIPESASPTRRIHHDEDEQQSIPRANKNYSARIDFDFDSLRSEIFPNKAQKINSP